MKVLVTGGAGYIGSTTCTALIEAGHTPIILDSLVTGRREFTKDRIFYEGDISDESLLRRIFADHPDICCAIHFAALIVVPESVERPYHYYHENVYKSLELFRILNTLGCNRIIFSSSASLYDNVPGFMVTEDAPLKPSSPYARTKYMMEMVLQDMSNAYGMQGIALRYFNPIGADPKMRTGLANPAPTHVLGKLVSTALGLEPEFQITGVDWPTRDGSGIRDYLHVWDLARAHVCAVENFENVFAHTEGNYAVINLGSGNGVTVKELVNAFFEVYGKPIAVTEAPPRPGDVAGAYANADKAAQLIGWKAELSIQQGIRDALKWADEERVKVLGY
ncbi:MAG: UDP-glucose 4-epimerase GalE [Eubacteriales bacterium]|nr:UDP-glucose 4-epimerase GalE [Eubacteriales bacterium]